MPCLFKSYKYWENPYNDSKMESIRAPFLSLQVANSGYSISAIRFQEPFFLVHIDGFLTLVNRIIWQKPHNCGFFYVKFIKF